MPIQIQRVANVYQLSDNTDLRTCFEDLGAAGWVCSLICSADGWVVRLQHNEKKQLIPATLSDVVVSDGVTVEATSVADYNTANPDNQIGGS